MSNELPASSQSTVTRLTEDTPNNPRVATERSRPLSPIRLTTPAWLFWSCILVLTTTVSATLGAIVAVLAPESPAWVNLVQLSQERSLFEFWQSRFQYRLTRPVNILILGIDGELSPSQALSDPFSGRSDTILLLRVDPDKDSVSLLSIPRDTQVVVPEWGGVKMSQVNTLGGTQLASKVVSQTLNQLPIDRYIRISTGAFRELVDLVDGVEVFVKRPMSYVDYTQNLRIDLSPGWQTLNGQQAEEFVRFRTDEYGDIGRVQRQQALIVALRHRLTNANVLPRLPKVLQVMQKYIDTDLSGDELLALAHFGLQIPPEAFKMVMLPGRYSDRLEYTTSYWIVDALGRDRILRDYFNRSWVGNVWDRETQSVATGRDPKSLKIAIQNATQMPELSSRVADYLEEQGYEDLYFTQDWPDPQHHTRIIVQKGDLKGAELLQKALGTGTIEATSTGDLDSDITVRIGSDFIDKLNLTKE